MRHATAFCLSGAAILGLVFVVASSSCKGSDSGGNGGDDGGESANCEGAPSNTPGTATAITFGAKQNGTLCPGIGANWYVLTVPTGDDLLDISVAYPGEVTTVTPYARLYAADGTTPLANGQVDGDAKVMNGAILTTVKLPSAGKFYLQVGDLFGQGDPNNTYTVQLTAAQDPDSYEPNDVVANAKTSGSASGWLAYRQDVDIFRRSLLDEAGTGRPQLLHLTLENPMTAHAPVDFSVTKTDGSVVTQGTAPPSATAFDAYYSLGSDTVGYVSLTYPATAEPDRTTADGYQLSLTSGPDPDPNEPNNTGATATFPCLSSAMAGSTCSSAGYTGTSTDFAANGYISYVSDVDYYRIDVPAGMTAAVLQITLTADKTAVDYAVDLIAPDGNSPCTSNDQCQVVNEKCTTATALTDCPLTHTCATATSGPFCPDGGTCSLCAGAETCVPSGMAKATTCGVTQYSLSDPNGGTTVDANGKNVVQTAQPLLQPGPYYVVVRDFKGQSFDTTNAYHLDLTVVPEPDPNDQSPSPNSRNNFYDPYQLNATAELSLSSKVATQIPNVPKMGSVSVSGYISYQTDEDWYVFTNPCQTKYCLVTFTWESASSSVDPAFFMYSGQTEAGPPAMESVWEAFTDVGSDGGVSMATKTFGGGADCRQCSFMDTQYQTYMIQVRDRNPGGSVASSHWDYSSMGQYRLTINVADDGSGCPSNCSYLMEAGLANVCGCYCATDANACPHR